jgi:hypothetical protein
MGDNNGREPFGEYDRHDTRNFCCGLTPSRGQGLNTATIRQLGS